MIGSRIAPTLFAALLFSCLALSDPEGDTLLRSVAIYNRDRVTKLVYADWLEEHGDPERARFIRLQCQVSENPTGEHAKAWTAEADELLKKNLAHWIPANLPKPSRYVVYGFEDGFIATITLSGHSRHRLRDFVESVPTLRDIVAKRAANRLEHPLDMLIRYASNDATLGGLNILLDRYRTGRIPKSDASRAIESLLRGIQGRTQSKGKCSEEDMDLVRALAIHYEAADLLKDVSHYLEPWLARILTIAGAPSKRALEYSVENLPEVSRGGQYYHDYDFFKNTQADLDRRLLSDWEFDSKFDLVFDAYASAVLFENRTSLLEELLLTKFDRRFLIERLELAVRAQNALRNSFSETNTIKRGKAAIALQGRLKELKATVSDAAPDKPAPREGICGYLLRKFHDWWPF